MVMVPDSGVKSTKFSSSKWWGRRIGPAPLKSYVTANNRTPQPAIPAESAAPHAAVGREFAVKMRSRRKVPASSHVSGDLGGLRMVFPQSARRRLGG